jgi:hypothetical protein
MKTIGLLVVSIAFAVAASAQQPSNPRVFVTDSASWEISGGLVSGPTYTSARISGGARPQTAEIVKTFGERCQQCTVTMKQDRADYVVVLDHEGGKEWYRRDNKFVVYDKNGDMVRSGSCRSLGNAVKDACQAISGNWRVAAPNP